MTILKEVKLIPIGKPTANNHLYCKEDVELFLNTTKNKTIFGTIDDPKLPNEKWKITYDLLVVRPFSGDNSDNRYATHVSENLNIKDDYLVCDVTILDTPKKDEVMEILTLPEYGFRPASFCTMNKSSEYELNTTKITNLDIVSINLVRVKSK